MKKLGKMKVENPRNWFQEAFEIGRVQLGQDLKTVKGEHQPKAKGMMTESQECGLSSHLDLDLNPHVFVYQLCDLEQFTTPNSTVKWGKQWYLTVVKCNLIRHTKCLEELCGSE